MALAPRIRTSIEDQGDHEHALDVALYGFFPSDNDYESDNEETIKINLKDKIMDSDSR